VTFSGTIVSTAVLLRDVDLRCWECDRAGTVVRWFGVSTAACAVPLIFNTNRERRLANYREQDQPHDIERNCKPDESS